MKKNQASFGQFDGDGEPNEYGIFDCDGFDSYGYNKDSIDRAGNHENDYVVDDMDESGNYFDGYNGAFEQALFDWSFDGVRPMNVNVA